MDDFKNQNDKREYLDGTAGDNKVKINFDSIESTESGFVQNERFGVAEEYDDMKTVAMEETPAFEQPVVPNVGVNIQPPVQPIQQSAPVQPPVQPIQQSAPVQPPVQPPVQNVYIQQTPQKNAPKKNAKQPLTPEAKKAKAAKRNKAFGAFVRVFVTVILSLVTLWTVMFTIDHTLAAQGIGPVFSYSEKEYTVSYIDSEDAGAWSYKCLGYKIQFVFDESGHLTQDCVWAWEEGPNDVLQQRGMLFEISAAEK